MNTSKLTAALLVASAPALAQNLEKWGYPDPDTFAPAIHTLCKEQHLTVMLAAHYRDKGKARDEVLALIPENPPSLNLRAVDVYRENVEDVYAYPDLGTYSVSSVRAEICRTEVMSARKLGRLSTVVSSVRTCEAKHGKERSNALYACLREVVKGM